MTTQNDEPQTPSQQPLDETMIQPLSIDEIRLDAIRKMEIADRLVELQTLLPKVMPGHRLVIVPDNRLPVGHRSTDYSDKHLPSAEEIEAEFHGDDKP